MRHSVISCVVLTAALAGSSLAFAATPQTTQAPTTQPRATHGHWTNHHRAMRDHLRAHRGMDLMRKLDLTDAQRASMHKWVTQDAATARSEHRALRNQRMALAKATPGTAAYQNAAKALASASANAASARILRHSALRANIYNLLTPAQRSKLADLHAQRKARMEKWRKSHAEKRNAAPATPSSTATI